MGIGSGRGGKQTRGSDGAWIRPWALGITANQKTCTKCTWVPSGKQWKLKFANRACRTHGPMMR